MKHPQRCPCLKCIRAMIRRQSGRHDIWTALVRNPLLVRPRQRLMIKRLVLR
jgi:hypothetical protein